MSPTDGTFIHVDASMNKLLKAFWLAKVKRRYVLGNFVDTNFDLFRSISLYFTKKKKKFLKLLQIQQGGKIQSFFFFAPNTQTLFERL